MLTVNISYASMDKTKEVNVEGEKVDFATHLLQVRLSSNSIVKIVHHPNEKYWFISFPADLAFEQFEIIHHFILNLKNICIEPKINDSRAFIGYLKDGSEACIYHNFEKWQSFILEAKHRSMEGQKVEVYDGEQKVANGILVECRVSDQRRFKIESATVLTQLGEQVFATENLSIQTTGEFF